MIQLKKKTEMKNNMGKKFSKIVIPIIVSILLQNVCLLGAVSYEVTAINELAMGRKNLESIVCVIIFYMLFVGTFFVFDILFYALDRYATEMFSLKQQKWMRKNIFACVIGKRQLSNEEKAETTSFINNDMPDIVEL